MTYCTIKWKRIGFYGIKFTYKALDKTLVRDVLKLYQWVDVFCFGNLSKSINLLSGFCFFPLKDDEKLFWIADGDVLVKQTRIFLSLWESLPNCKSIHRWWFINKSVSLKVNRKISDVLVIQNFKQEHFFIKGRQYNMWCFVTRTKTFLHQKLTRKSSESQ